MGDLEGSVADDELAYEPLAALGWSVESLSWTSELADWGAFDLAVIRTTWDYYLDPAAFIRVLEAIHETGPRPIGRESPFKAAVVYTYLFA